MRRARAEDALCPVQPLPGTARTHKGDDEGWAGRCAYWALQAGAEKSDRRRKPERHPLLILTGHGMRLRVDNGALLVQNGFTHYPQRREEFRFFLEIGACHPASLSSTAAAASLSMC